MKKAKVASLHSIVLDIIYSSIMYKFIQSVFYSLHHCYTVYYPCDEMIYGGPNKTLEEVNAFFF